jgi:hypothetical protein
VPVQPERPQRARLVVSVLIGFTASIAEVSVISLGKEPKSAFSYARGVLLPIAGWSTQDLHERFPNLTTPYARPDQSPS